MGVSDSLFSRRDSEAESEKRRKKKKKRTGKRWR